MTRSEMISELKKYGGTEWFLNGIQTKDLQDLITIERKKRGIA